MNEATRALIAAGMKLPTLGSECVRRLISERLLSNATRGAPARQRTLRSALEWSHALLDVPEQVVLRRLSVFAGGFRLDTAQHVAVAEGLTDSAVIDAIDALAGKSLLQVQRCEPLRYRLLETMRAFAAEQLDAAGETAAARRRHGASRRPIYGTLSARRHH